MLNFFASYEVDKMGTVVINIQLFSVNSVKSVSAFLCRSLVTAISYTVKVSNINLLKKSATTGNI